MESDKKIIENTLWKLLEKVFTYLITFVLSLIIARLLGPKDYGLIAMVTVFIAIADVFVTSGFGSALIQDKEADNAIFSTVLYLNIFIALILYIVLFLLSPIVSTFFKEPKLSVIMRVLSIRVVFGSIKSILDAYFIKKMQFKKLSYISFVSNVISAFVGLVMAYSGYGVWALVALNLANSVISVILEFVVAKWKPTFYINYRKIKKIVIFGSKLLIGGIIETVGNQLSQLIIGRRYSSEDLGLYNRGQSFPQLVTSIITSSIAAVTYPVMAETQENSENLLDLTRRSERMTIYLSFPLLFGLIAVSKPLIIVLLSDKWADSIIYLQILCLVQIIITPNYSIQNAVCAIGKSGVKLFMDIIRKVIYVILLVSLMSFGVVYIAITDLIVSIICILMIMIVAKKYIKYSFRQYFLDHFKILFTSILMCVFVYLLSFFKLSLLLLLIMQIIVGVFMYVLFSILFKIEEFYYLKNKVFNFFKK